MPTLKSTRRPQTTSRPWCPPCRSAGWFPYVEPIEGHCTCTAYQYNPVSGHYGSGDFTGRPSGCPARQNIDLMLDGGQNRTPPGPSSLVLVTGDRSK